MEENKGVDQADGLQYTPLTGIHQALGAKMAPFAGYYMPISYKGIREEHTKVRSALGVFDVSHMGEFIVKGRQALDLVQKVTCNDASRLRTGEAQYSCLLNESGGVIDDLLVYRLSEDNCAAGEQAFMLVVNASNISKDFDWIVGHNDFDTRVINISEQSGLLAVQGPLAAKALQSLTDVDLASIEYYHFVNGRFAGIENVIISATGYTGAGGFELYADTKFLPVLWEAVIKCGQPYGIEPIGLGARDTLRLEMGYCLYGNDLDEATSPLEAGLNWIVKLQKPYFIGQSALQLEKTSGIKRKLVGLVAHDRRAPRHGYTIENLEEIPVGIITSGTISPSLDLPIGLGFVNIEHSAPGTVLNVLAGSKKLKAEVTKPPFIKG